MLETKGNGSGECLGDRTENMVFEFMEKIITSEINYGMIDGKKLTR